MENRPTDGEVWCIYQDCPMCGAREKWGEEQTRIANSHGKVITKVGFTDARAKGHMLAAIEATKNLPNEQRVVTFPFFYDGKHYAPTMEVLVGNYAVEAPKPKKKTKKKYARRKEVAVDESV